MVTKKISRIQNIPIFLFMMFLVETSMAQLPDLTKSHHPDPPIPVEVFFGNNGLYYQTNAKKTFSPDGKISLFTLATYAADYNNDLSRNRQLIEGQLNYTLLGGLGIMAGTDINSVTGFSPIVGPQHTLASRKFLAVTIASFFLNEKRDFKVFGLYEYKPSVGPGWSLYNRLQFIYNHSMKEGSHNRSYLYLRTGVKKDAFVFGIGANLDQFGPEKVFEVNYGMFIRWEFK